MKAKIKRQELGSSFAHPFSSSRSDCKERRESGGNFVVSLGISSVVGNDMPEVASHE